MSQELTPKQDPVTSKEVEVAKQSPEELPRAPRFVVFGTRASGTDEVLTYLEGAVKDIPGSEVERARYVTSIDSAFFGRLTKAPVEQLALPSAEAKKESVFKRFTSLVLRKTVEAPDSGFSSGFSQEYVTRPDSIPQGVVVFSEMRQHDPYTGSNMNVSTPIDKIKGLCEQYNVPLVYATNEQSVPDIEQATRQLTSGEAQPS